MLIEPTLAAILARFQGNAHDAVNYCIRVAIEYPQFAKEYNEYAEQLARRS